VHLIGWLYAFLSFLELRPKLAVTPAWFDGTLGALNNETILALVSVYFVDRLRASSLWGGNVHGILRDLQQAPLNDPRAAYLSMFFIFNVLWIFALLRLSDKPRYVRATLIRVPAFVIPHMLTGIIYEVRQNGPARGRHPRGFFLDLQGN